MDIERADLRIDEADYRNSKAPAPDVLKHAFDYVWAGTADGLSVDERLRRFRLLTPGQQILMPSNSLHGDVMNGGFQQYFYNSGSMFCHEALHGLRAMGADDHARLLERAIDAFPDGHVPRDRAARLLALYGGDRATLKRELRRHEEWSEDWKQWVSSPRPATSAPMSSNAEQVTEAFTNLFDDLDGHYYQLERTDASLERVHWPHYVQTHLHDFVRRQNGL
jgi:hypothetical protein